MYKIQVFKIEGLYYRGSLNRGIPVFIQKLLPEFTWEFFQRFLSGFQEFPRIIPRTSPRIPPSTRLRMSLYSSKVFFKGTSRDSSRDSTRVQFPPEIPSKIPPQILPRIRPGIAIGIRLGVCQEISSTSFPLTSFVISPGMIARMYAKNRPRIPLKLFFRAEPNVTYFGSLRGNVLMYSVQHTKLYYFYVFLIFGM